MPSISPGSIGSADYTVTGSRAVVADLALDVMSSPPFSSLQLRFPAGAGGVTVAFGRGAHTLALPTSAGGALNDTVTFPNRRVTAQSTKVGDEIVIDWEVRATSAAAENEMWSVRARAATEQTWRFSVTDDDPAEPAVTRVMCDPACDFSIGAASLANGTVREKDTVTLTAAPADGPAGAPTIVGIPIPAATYRWNSTVPIAGLPTCSMSPVTTFQTPQVASNLVVSLTADVWFETDCSAVGFLNASSTPRVLTVVPRPANAMPDLVGEPAGAVISLLSCVNLENVDHCLNFLGDEVNGMTKNTPRDLGNFFFTVTRNKVRFDLVGDPTGLRIATQFPPPGVLVPREATITLRYAP